MDILNAWRLTGLKGTDVDASLEVRSNYGRVSR
jgi:hypothetical protein